MSERAFFDPGARQRTAEAVGRVESHTAAEVVVSARQRSADYPNADLWVGFAASLAVLCALLYLPMPFDIAWFPVDVVVGFAAGVLVGRLLPPLRRLLAGRRRMRETVRTAARAAFHDLGISRTSGRTGILVYVSLFERRVEVVHDIGVEPRLMGSEWDDVVARLADAVRKVDLDSFVAALESMGPVLGAVLERSEDDVNELPDAVDAA